MRKRQDKDKARTSHGAAHTGDDSQNTYSFYGERMRLGKTRMEVYDEVDGMDSDDLPGATLDTYAEDATAIDPATQRVLWIEDCSEDIRKLCEDCLERIQIEEYAFLIARSLAKYGDFPIELYWEPGEGVNLMRFHHPKRFRRFEELETGQLVGFHIGDGAYGAQEPNTQPWEVVHFRIFGALSALYGTTMLLSTRRPYRRLRLAEDGDVVYRMQRHPDRDVFYVDCTGLTDQEESDYLERFRVGMKKHKYYDPTTGQLREDWNPYTVNEDLIVPQVKGRETKIERLRGSNNANDATNLHWYLARYHAAARIIPSYFGYSIEGAQPHDPKQKLAQQDSRYARIPAKLQKYFLLGIHRILQLNLSFQGIDPTAEENKFTVAMAPVSYLDELHRQQLIEIRIDIIDRLLNMGQQVGFNMQIWVRYVLKQYGKLAEGLIEELMMGGTGPQAGAGQEPMPGEPLSSAGTPTPPPPLPGASEQTGMPVGTQPGLESPEFESLPGEAKILLRELVSRLNRANKLVEDAKCSSGRALKYYHNEITESERTWWQESALASKKPLRESSSVRSEDDMDLLPPETDDDEDDKKEVVE